MKLLCRVAAHAKLPMELYVVLAAQRHAISKLVPEIRERREAVEVVRV